MSPASTSIGDLLGEDSVPLGIRYEGYISSVIPVRRNAPGPVLIRTLHDWRYQW
jgi:hypothetical protein